jgi:hypothetical protein
MGLNGADLLPDEKVMTSRRARAVTADDGEATGGRLYLTNYRLVFRPRGARRTPGGTAVLLPTVKDLRHTPDGRRERLEVVTGTQRLTFTVRGALRLIAAIVLRVDVDAERLRQIAGAALSGLPAACADPEVARRVAEAHPGLATLPSPQAAIALSGTLPTTPATLNLAEFLTDERLR